MLTVLLSGTVMKPHITQKSKVKGPIMLTAVLTGTFMNIVPVWITGTVLKICLSCTRKIASLWCSQCLVTSHSQQTEADYMVSCALQLEDCGEVQG